VVEIAHQATVLNATAAQAKTCKISQHGAANIVGIKRVANASFLMKAAETLMPSTTTQTDQLTQAFGRLIR
jgi:hypothetical protein